MSSEPIKSEPAAEVAENDVNVEVVKEEPAEDKLIDDMNNIEREIAIMHEIEEIADDATAEGENRMTDQNTTLDETSGKFIYEMDVSGEEANEPEAPANAIRKSTDRRNGVSTACEAGDAPDSTGSPAPAKEMESQLEHDDLLAVLKGTDDKDNSETGVTIEGEGEFQIVDIIDNDQDVAETDPLAKDSPKKDQLTKAEEQKMALEQYHLLELRKNNLKNRRRKQEIKSISQSADLLTSLVSDWSDGDELHQDDNPSAPLTKKKTVQAKVATPAKQPPQEAVPTVAVKEKEKPTVSQPQKRPINSSATQPAPQSKKVTNAPVAQEKKVPEIPPPAPFRRTRIIKRKIIWDPDAPETQFSYAKLVKPCTPIQNRKEPKKERATPVVKKKEEPPAKPSTPVPSTPTKRQLQDTSSSLNGSKKKKFSEIDRLLGDEGAANMLNSLEGERVKRSSESEASKTPSVRKSTAASRSITPLPADKTQSQVKKESPLPKRRTPKSKASTSWDYVYKKQPEDSMIIRRRSNSSYSSSASANRLSVDGPAAGKQGRNIVTKPVPKTNSSSTPTAQPSTNVNTRNNESGKQFEFAKPELKNKLRKMKNPVILLNPLTIDMKKAVGRRLTKSPSETNNQSDVTVHKFGSVRQVMFNTRNSKINDTFTVQLMNTLSNVLEQLDRDNDCNAVLLLSERENFCQGIDVTDMVNGPADKRKAAVVAMARAVKTFLTTLVKFRKPLIAGVKGANCGLGVIMLPIFDVIIGSDDGTYETHYAKIGQIPEGNFLFSETPKIRTTFKTKLLWFCEKLRSTESALSGLVNKLTGCNSVHEDALSCARKIASMSTETFVAIKKLQLERNLDEILENLDAEEALLINQWSSAACVEKFKNFINKGQW